MSPSGTVLSNPPVPYSGPVPGGIFPGKFILVAGTVLPGPYRFAIDFECTRSGCSGKPDIAFHFNPRFDQRTVVCNTLTNNTWGPEEINSSHFPFMASQSFEIIVHVEQDCYKVSVNRRHYLEYCHRLPWKSVNFLSINGTGTVRIKTLRFYTNQDIQPTQRMQPSGPIMPAPSSTSLQPIHNPALPFTYPFRGGLSVGQIIYISGKPPPQPYRIHIDFYCDSERDIAFHFNPRFDERCVVRNSRIGNSWGSEERTAYCFPFAPNVSFDMMIEVLGDRFAVAVNGQHFAAYHHRIMPVSRVGSLHIEGHVAITSVRFH